MIEDGDQRIEIDADEVLEVISGTAPIETFAARMGPANIHVGDIMICKITLEADSYTVTHLACSDPRHGVHHRLHALSQQLTERLRKMQPATEPTACAMCNGSGWLHAQSGFARRLVLMATIFGMFRGIPLKLKGDSAKLSPQGLHDILSGFLADPGTPSGSTGAHPDRAFFSQAEEGEEGDDDDA